MLFSRLEKVSFLYSLIIDLSLRTYSGSSQVLPEFFRLEQLVKFEAQGSETGSCLHHLFFNCLFKA